MNDKPVYILNVDDDDAGRYLTTRILRQAGFEVIEAATGKEALHLAEANPDLILLDVRLPDMSGLEVCRQIKAIPRLAAIPIIHLSAAFTGEGDRATGLEQGADGYLIQPVDSRVLIATVNSLLRLKRVEQALRESEERLSFALQTIQTGAWDYDLRNHTLQTTLISNSLFGYETAPPEWSHTMFLEHVLPEDRPAIESRITEAISIQSDLNFECRIRRTDGEERWIWVVSRNVRDPSGTIERISGIVQDITKRKREEEETAKLQVQLQQAMKMDSIGRLAGGVAHDFNNMLGVIIGNTQMVMEGMELTSANFEGLTEIRKAAERSAELTRNLLAFARKQTVSPKVIDLNDIITDMLKMLQRLIGESITLQWQPKSGLWLIKMDPSQIDQMLANLCVNARDAITDVGNISIQTDNIIIDQEFCTTHAGFTPGDYVILNFTDSGCGMDSELQLLVFEPFFTTKGVGAGTGLGLSCVYGAVKQNNGFINVNSEPGHGTTFTIYIPRFVSSTEQVQAEGVGAPTMRGHETVLLVEDEPAILRMSKMMLERLGYTVITASTPGEATNLAEQYQGVINLLLTDVVMPEMNGRNLAKSLQSHYPDLRILFMSGYTSDVIASQGKLDDDVYFIQKPFSMNELSAKIRQVLEAAPHADGS